MLQSWLVQRLQSWHGAAKHTLVLLACAPQTHITRQRAAPHSPHPCATPQGATPHIPLPPLPLHSQAILDSLLVERGQLSLEHLRELPCEDIKAQLGRYKGVGPKSIACVMLFCLGRNECPVDTHVWEISKQVGPASRHGAVLRGSPAACLQLTAGLGFAVLLLPKHVRACVCAPDQTHAWLPVCVSVCAACMCAHAAGLGA